MRNPNVLIIVEGSKSEPRFFSRLAEVFSLDLKIYCLKTNIYALYKRMKDIGFNGDIKSILAEMHPEQKNLLSLKFAYTYLIFDCDAHHPKALEKRSQEEIVLENLAKLKEMSDYFVDETDPTIGKLYVNYPMMESYRDCDDFFDPNYAERSIALTDMSSYKSLVSKRKLCSLHVKSFSESQFSHLTLQNLCKLNKIHHEKWRVPDYPSYLEDSSQTKILGRQRNRVEREGRMSVLNTSLFLVTDYFGNRDGFYDRLASLLPF